MRDQYKIERKTYKTAVKRKNGIIKKLNYTIEKEYIGPTVSLKRSLNKVLKMWDNYFRIHLNTQYRRHEKMPLTLYQRHYLIWKLNR